MLSSVHSDKWSNWSHKDREVLLDGNEACIAPGLGVCCQNKSSDFMRCQGVFFTVCDAMAEVTSRAPYLVLAKYDLL